MATATHKFPLKKGSKEFPDRFGGLEVEYQYPADWDTLVAMADAALVGFVPKDGETAPTRQDLLYNLAMHQSGHLNIQKAIKAYLDTEAAAAQSTAEAVASAVARGEKEVVTIPGTRRGEGRTGKVARAEARAEKAEQKEQAALALLEQQYLLMPKSARASFAARLIEQGILTQERVAELNATQA